MLYRPKSAFEFWKANWGCIFVQFMRKQYGDELFELHATTHPTNTHPYTHTHTYTQTIHTHLYRHAPLPFSFPFPLFILRSRSPFPTFLSGSKLILNSFYANTPCSHTHVAGRELISKVCSARLLLHFISSEEKRERELYGGYTGCSYIFFVWKAEIVKLLLTNTNTTS